jgi:hypothetical protein
MSAAPQKWGGNDPIYCLIRLSTESIPSQAVLGVVNRAALRQLALCPGLPGSQQDAHSTNEKGTTLKFLQKLEKQFVE